MTEKEIRETERVSERDSETEEERREIKKEKKRQTVSETVVGEERERDIEILKLTLSNARKFSYYLLLIINH